MLKVLVTSLALALFGTAFVAVKAQAEFKPCIQAPKNYLPCFTTSQRPQFPKVRTR
jgi:hypothetical protein